MPQQTAPPGRRDRKKQQTRQALMQAALRLVDERGLEHVTVEEIAEAADVSPRTFFNYFTSKDEALLGDEFGAQQAMRERFLAVPSAVPTLSALVIAMAPDLEAVEGERDLWLMRFRVMDANPALLAALIKQSASAEQELVNVIAGRLGVPASSAYPQLVAAVSGAALRTSVMRWAASGGALRLPALVVEAFDLLAAGLTDPAPG